jgi:hypothetical protein
MQKKCILQNEWFTSRASIEKPFGVPVPQSSPSLMATILMAAAAAAGALVYSLCVFGAGVCSRS